MEVDLDAFSISLENDNIDDTVNEDSKLHLCFCSSIDDALCLPNSQHHFDLASSTPQLKCLTNKHACVYPLICDEIYANGVFSSVEFNNYLGNHLATQFCRPVTILLVKKINSILTNKLFC